MFPTRLERTGEHFYKVEDLAERAYAYVAYAYVAYTAYGRVAYTTYTQVAYSAYAYIAYAYTLG
ncbi:hypothetical protein VTH06DRAFT_8807 [Thermothelomyces fergusii]